MRKELRVIQGLSKDELRLVIKSSKFQLPKSYLKFLELYGKKCGDFGSDSEILYPSMIGLNDELAELISEEKLEITIPEKAYIFHGYQGFQYRFFICEKNDDPAVFGVMDGGSPPEKITESFTKYIEWAAGVSI